MRSSDSPNTPVTVTAATRSDVFELEVSNPNYSRLTPATPQNHAAMRANMGRPPDSRNNVSMTIVTMSASVAPVAWGVAGERIVAVTSAHGGRNPRHGDCFT